MLFLLLVRLLVRFPVHDTHVKARVGGRHRLAVSQEPEKGKDKVRQLHRTGHYIIIWTTICLMFFQPVPQIHAQTADRSTQQTDALATTPDTLVDEPLLEWTISDRHLYWANRCIPTPDLAAAAVQSPNDHYLLQRMPLNGGATRTLVDQPHSNCHTFTRMAADSERLYYYNAGQSRIETVAVDRPSAGAETFVANVSGISTDLLIAGGYLYWGRNSGPLQRIALSGGSVETVTTAPAYPNDIVVSGNRLYWIDNGDLWTIRLDCNSCQRSRFSPVGGSSLLAVQGNFVGSNIYWVAPSNTVSGTDRIVTQIPVIDGVRDITVYTAPSGYRIGKLTPQYGGFPSGLTHLYWTENNSTAAGDKYLRRLKVGESSADIIAANDKSLDKHVYLGSAGIYYAQALANEGRIFRLPYNAEALTRDMTAAAWEVTQAVQNLENSVPLVAYKPTYVRFYGEQVAGTINGDAEAWLEGYDNDGKALPGSPLSPINGTQTLATGATLNRGTSSGAETDWLFRLPASWYNHGTIELRGVVDPRQSFSDPNRSNNTLTGSFTFAKEPEPCLFFWPVKTHEPLPSYADPIFWQTIDRLVSLWPVQGATAVWHGEPIRELEACLDWDLHCWGPWELGQGWSATNFPPDKDRLLAKLVLRQAIARAESPQFCDVGGSVHTVGMVNGDTEGGPDGYANFFFNASFVKFKDEETLTTRPWNQPSAGATLAQELTHNFWRYHLGCVMPDEDSAFGLGDFPYENRCRLDDRALTAPTTHYGFDPISQSVIRPYSAGDFMTYRFPRWVSDYTFKDVKGQFGLLANAAAQPKRASAEIIFVTGAYEPLSTMGHLYYTYVLPPEMVSSDPAQALTAAGLTPHQHHHGAEPEGKIRLRRADDTVITETAIDLLAPDSHGAERAIYTFVTELPVPGEAVAAIDLIVDGKVVATRTPSANAPVVTILAPAVNSTLGESITLRWQATDADNDELLYSVNYSPDGGTTWLPILVEIAGDLASDITTVTLESPETFPGSGGNNGQLRVIASDGYNTTIAEVGPFTVADRAPQTFILAPTAEEWFAATESVTIRGIGYDAEAGSVNDEQLTWQVNGTSAGTGRQQLIDGLGPGIHTVALSLTDGQGQSTTTEGEINVLPLSIPEATRSPSLDGRCHDSAYGSGIRVALEPYENGGQAGGYLVKRNDHLWLCLAGLERSPDNDISNAGLRLDPNHSRDTVAQSDDLRFVVAEDGTPIVRVGDGNGGFNIRSDESLTYQIAATESTWSAELRVDGAALGLWQQAFGLTVGHYNRGGENNRVDWPYAAEPANPSTWAEVAPGLVPVIEVISPTQLAQGETTATLIIDGKHFDPDATLLWNGNPLPATTVVSPTQLSVEVDSSLLANAGRISLRAQNQATAGYQSNPLRLTIYNPKPTVTSLAPNRVDAGTAQRVVTVSGRDFVSGAQVYWDSEPLETTVVDGTTLEATVPGALLVDSRAVGITVRNTAPHLGASNVMEFVVADSMVMPHQLYLPVVVR